MVACRSLYHTLSASIERHLAPLGIATPARVRLALLVTGLIAAQSAVLAQIARHLFALDLTAARETASIARRLRRTLNDAALTSACHLPAVRAALPPCLTRRPLLVALDVHPRVAMAILRHSKIAVTMDIYSQVSSASTKEALKRLGNQFGEEVL